MSGKKFILTLLLVIMCQTGVFSQKVFMTGDSHVFAKIYPQKVEEIIREKYPETEFSQWSKNGICFYSFNSNPSYYDSIFSFRPEILIVHLGTNGAYDNSFTRKAFRQEMENFYTTLTDTLPNVKVVFVTPFTNKKRKYRKKGKWRVNYKNRDVANEIIAFTQDHPHTFVIDNNAEAGMMFLNSKTLIRPDNVHLTEQGYKLLGETIGKEVLEIEELWPDTAKEPENSENN